MTDELYNTIRNLYEKELLIVRVAGRWIDKSHGQEKVSVVCYNDKYYQVVQKRVWWSNQLTLDCGWDYTDPKIVEVKFVTKVKKVVTKMWKEIK